LEFVDRCDKEWDLNVVWLETVVNPVMGIGGSFKKVNFHSASRNGQPFEAVISKYGIPNVARPFCTRELKLNPIKKYMQSLGLKHWVSAIGIRLDEMHRINRVTAQKERKIYPLADDLKCTKEFIRNWWKKQSFDLGLDDYEGNCDLCYKKSDRKLLTLLLEKPKLAHWWNEMEIKYEGGNYSFFRKNRTTKDMIAEANTKQFARVTDPETKKAFDPGLDLEFDCLCKST